MRSWTISEARAKIAEVFDAALTSGPQKIERRDSEPVVVIAESDWKRLAAEYPDRAALILDAPIAADDLQKRRPARAAKQDFF